MRHSANPSPSNILIVLPDLRGGGAERLHCLLANHWREHNIAVGFALLRRQGELLETLREDIAVEDLSAARIRDAILPLTRLLRQQRPQVTLAAMWPLTTVAVIAWCLAGRPGRLFLSEHSILSLSCLRQLRVPAWLLRGTLRLGHSLATGLVAVSRGVQDDLCRLSGFSADRVRVIYNAAATGITRQPPTAEALAGLWGECDYRLLSVGSLKAAKDQAQLIRAFAALPRALNAKLAIVGEGPLRAELTGLCQALGVADRVLLPGFCADPYPWFLSADLFVLASQWEGFGNVLVEALECGLPVVSTDCPGGPREILDQGRYGTLVPVGDHRALAAALADALTRPHDREAAIKRAAMFSVPVIAEQYLAYFNGQRF